MFLKKARPILEWGFGLKVYKKDQPVFFPPYNDYFN
jgi:hypothetical protein